MENIRVRLKAGDREFEAEGPRAAVEERLAEVRRWILEAPEATHGVLPPTPLPAHALPNTVFDVDWAQGRLKLRVLPPAKELTERVSRALLLLLHGYQLHIKAPQVSVTRLADDLRLSGFAGLKRLSRVFQRLEAQGLAIRSGAGKGTRYRPTNPGLETARRIIRSLNEFLPPPSA